MEPQKAPQSNSNLRKNEVGGITLPPRWKVTTEGEAGQPRASQGVCKYIMVVAFFLTRKSRCLFPWETRSLKY